MFSKVPAYYVSNLSRALERPKPEEPIYTALHGPPANDQDIGYELNGNTWEPRVDDKIIKNWKVPGALYLYHGERFCMNHEDQNNQELFSFDRDASKVNYQSHQRTLDLHDGTTSGTELGLRNCLMKTSGMPQLPVKTLLARDVVPNADERDYLDVRRDMVAGVLDLPDFEI